MNFIGPSKAERGYISTRAFVSPVEFAGTNLREQIIVAHRGRESRVVLSGSLESVGVDQRSAP